MPAPAAQATPSGPAFQSAEEDAAGLRALASGTYNPQQVLSDYLAQLATLPVSKTVQAPNGQEVSFQLPKLKGKAGKVARGVVALAQHYLGTPYVWGGETPKGFDCSGLAQYIYAAMGLKIPRTSEEQFQAGAAVP